MSATRREVLSLAALGAVAARRWDDDRLGIFCHLGTEEATARKTLAAARAAGFRRAQISFPWPRVSEAYLKSLPGWLASEGIRAEVLSAYVNCLNPEVVLMDCRRQDFARALDVAGTVGCRCLAAWTGSHIADLMKSDLRNFAPAAAEAIVEFLGAQAQHIERAGLTLALETYITLACPDAPTLGRVLDRLPKCIGAVLDPPNLTPPKRYAQRDQVLREMVSTLKNRVALVHLKDFRLGPDGESYSLPGPLQGELNYPLYVREILALDGSPPIVAEHLSIEEYAGARRKLLPLFRASAAS
jgi:sugar phosphate isomerase/epimerase